MMSLRTSAGLCQQLPKHLFPWPLFLLGKHVSGFLRSQLQGKALSPMYDGSRLCCQRGQARTTRGVSNNEVSY